MVEFDDGNQNVSLFAMSTDVRCEFSVSDMCGEILFPQKGGNEHEL